MKLPNSKNAYIPKEKLSEYLLSETHPVGKFKAKFFRKLGFDETNIAKLEKSLLLIAYKNDTDEIKETPYGINYIIRGSIKLPRYKSSIIKTVWFIESGKTKPRFVTAFPAIINKRSKTQ